MGQTISLVLRRPLAPLLVAALVSAAATAAVVLIPALRFAYRLPDVHVAIETAAALIGLLASFLVLGRFGRSGQLEDFALSYSLALLACSNLFFAALPAVAGSGIDQFSTWARLIGQLLGALVLAFAAFVPRRRVRLRRRAALLGGLSLPLVLGAIAVLVGIFGSNLPSGVELVPTPEESGRPRLEGSALLLGAQIAATILYCVAAVGFARKARRRGDEMLEWLAVAAVFGAFARLNYFLYPSLYTDWVYSGDVFRLVFYIGILAAAAREISSYWATLSHTAVLEERRRIARDLHDGLAQELAFIGRNLTRLDDGDETVGRLRASAQRALSESRQAIAALTKPLDVPLEVTLGEAARETAEREGTEVDVVVSPGLELDYERRDALIRIACEATTNAARHGAAGHVRVEVVDDSRKVRLRVVDDGRGFDPDAAGDRRHNGLGLIGMRERAQALGGSFEVRSRPGLGTTVEVVV